MYNLDFPPVRVARSTAPTTFFFVWYIVYDQTMNVAWQIEAVTMHGREKVRAFHLLVLFVPLLRSKAQRDA